MRLFFATSTFFTILFNKQKASEIRQLLLGQTPPKLSHTPEERDASSSSSKLIEPKSGPAKASVKAARSDALTLLSALQREARLLDLVSEPLDQYSDAQIGAAARDVIRDTKKCIDKLFSVRPLVDQTEGEKIEIPTDPSPVRWRINGGSANKGTLVHPGWAASKVELPTWTGGSDDHLVLAATEVEV